MLKAAAGSRGAASRDATSGPASNQQDGKRLASHSHFVSAQTISGVVLCAYTHYTCMSTCRDRCKVPGQSADTTAPNTQLSQEA
jgi:hypothetical protein